MNFIRISPPLLKPPAWEVARVLSPTLGFEALPVWSCRWHPPGVEAQIRVTDSVPNPTSLAVASPSVGFPCVLSCVAP